jgi:hypothetical protein
MRKLYFIQIFLFLILSINGCAYVEAGKILNQAETNFKAFEGDFVNMSQNSLEREWNLKRAISDVALQMDTTGKQYNDEDVRKLVQKYVNVYQEDVLDMEKQRQEHMKALINSQTGRDLLQAVSRYHNNGVSSENITVVLEGIIPSLSEIIKKQMEANNVNKR